MEVPVVTPSNTPERIFTASGSRLWVVYLEVPGLRFSSHTWMSASDNGRRGGTPSTTQPIAGPWLSPKVVKRKSVPKVLLDMAGALLRELGAGQQFGNLGSGIHRHHADGVISGIDV